MPAKIALRITSTSIHYEFEYSIGISTFMEVKVKGTHVPSTQVENPLLPIPGVEIYLQHRAAENIEL